MNDMITIENTEMQIREYAGQRVVTFKDIDTVHGNKSGTAKSNFARHKKHFIEGEDYILLTRGNFKSDKLSLLNIDIPTRGITVLTESGYLLIAKSFNDDLSWNVQRQLVNSYFRVRYQHPLPQIATKSSTPVPRNQIWYGRNRNRLKFICKTIGCEHKQLYHFILKKLSEEYNLSAANQIYKKECGHKPQYPMDVVDYFPELGLAADKILDVLEESAEKEAEKKKEAIENLYVL